MDIALLVKDLKLGRNRMVGVNLMSVCPNPTHEDRTPSFGLNIETFDYNCYGCGFKGSGLKSLFTKLLLPIPDWVAELDSRPRFVSKAAREMPARHGKIESAVRDTWIPILTANPEAAAQYLAPRLIPTELVGQFRIGYNIRKDILFFPIFKRDGGLRGWVERSDNYAERYRVMPPGVARDTLLYGEWMVPAGEPNNLYVVEGPVDALKLWSWGFKAVALNGSFMYEWQAKAILEIADQVFIVPDNDKGGLKMISSCIKLLKGKTKLYGVNLPEGIKDTGEVKCTKDMFIEAVRNRIQVK